MLVDRPAAVRRFKRMSDAVAADDSSDSRIRDLAVLLAASGALAARLSQEERMLAYRRLRHVMEPGEGSPWRPAESLGAAPMLLDTALLAAGVGGLAQFHHDGGGAVGHHHHDGGMGGHHHHHG